MSIIINPKSVLKFLFTIIIILAVLSLISHYYEVSTKDHRYLANMFNLDWEGNIPTWFASMNILLCSILLLFIAVYKKSKKEKYRYHWAFLSFIFFVMSLDEILILHEQTIAPLREFFGASGIFYFAWVILALILLPIIALAYLEFVLNLHEKIKPLFITSAIVFLSGALGMELVNGYIFDQFGRDNYLYVTMTDIEETLELLGIAFFTYTLLLYIEISINSIRFSINSGNISLTNNLSNSKSEEQTKITEIN